MLSAIIHGRVSSNTSTSFENLDSILPVGVVSKKLKGDRKILPKSFSCKILAANQKPNCGARL